MKRSLRPRVIIYTVILGLICAAWAFSLATRAPLRVDVERDRATLARMVEDGWIENVYRLQLMNLTERPQRYTVTAQGLPGLVADAPSVVEVAPAASRWVSVTLKVPPETAQATGPGAHAVSFQVRQEAAAGEPVLTISEGSTFVLPR